LESFQIKVEDIEQAITDQTRVLMVPSLIGNIPDQEVLQDLAQKHDLIYIEDSADTLGAEFDGRPTGSYSDISTSSFYGSHIITAFGGGGMISVNDSERAEDYRVLRAWGRSSATHTTEDIEARYQHSLGGNSYDSKFVFEKQGFNFLPLEASAAFGLEQLERLDGFIEKRRENFRDIEEFLEGYSEYFITPKEHPKARTAWHAFPITVRDSAPFSREEIVRALEGRNIQTRPVFSGNILKQPAFKDMTHSSPRDDFPNAERIMESSFIIGCHQGLTGDQISHAKSVFETFLEGF